MTLIKPGNISSEMTTDSELTSGLALKYDASNPNGYETPVQLATRDTNNRNRSNHTGTQLAATISDFLSSVLGTVLTGLSTATNSVINSSDTVLSALGKLQAQITNLNTNVDGGSPTSVFSSGDTTINGGTP